MIDKDLVQEAVKLSREGASLKDLPVYLFVSPDEFKSWFDYGKDLVNEGFGREATSELKSAGEVDDFDILCLLLYKGVMRARWEIRKQMHRLVSDSDNPNLGFKYLEAIYAFDSDTERDESEEDEHATTFVMENFFKDQGEVYKDEDGKFLESSEDEKNTEQDSQNKSEA